LAIAPTPREAESLFADLKFFLSETGDLPPLARQLHLFPSWEVLPFERLSPHPQHVGARLEGLYRLLEDRAPVLISTPASLMQRVIPRDALRGSYLYLVAGQDLARERLLEHLDAWGFTRVPIVEERGDFSVRGAIVDLFPPGYNLPLRLEFDADRLESVREFEPSTQRSRARHEEMILLPLREFSLQSASREEILRKIDWRARELEIGLREKNEIIETLRDGRPFAGMESLLPYFYSELDSIFSYLPADAFIFVVEPDQVEAEAERFARLVNERAAKAEADGRLAPPPGGLYLNEREWRDAMKSFVRIESEALTVMPRHDGESEDLHVSCYANADLHQEISLRQGREPSLAPLAARLREWRDERVVLVAPTAADAGRLSQLLGYYGADVNVTEREFDSFLASEEPTAAIVVGELTQGFRLPSERLVIVTADEIFGTQRSRRPLSQRVAAGHFIASLNELKEGDTIVHLDHGVGVYCGLKFLSVGDVSGEFLHLEYAGADRLYLPVDRVNLVQKYAAAEGDQPSLDRLGGTSWERVKARTRKAVMAMAKELVEIYAARRLHQGRAFSPPDHLYQEFAASFEFEETPDQLRAIEDVLRDMQRKKPMDRLICGDVGYGKTEVAMRAAFLAVMDGGQVAILTPTTVLAQQHLNTFRHRFRAYPVRIEMLNRLLGGKESQAVLAGLASGAVDIVIGTHRLLQNDVQFKDLGLVIVDEEHRFGVKHKEALKRLRRFVHVLNLTATPIPRTLHMSLTGLRDMTVIETPPLDRQAIQTYVTRYDDGVVRDAILRELQRGGQVFFLHNRVETIVRMAEKVADLAPEATVAVAHGQMRPRELEKVMADFLDNRIQVLVCSAIIESGLDFPNANTMIINRADRFGLAQLYQLRGRVGRSSRRAYAYLLVPGEHVITRDAQRRLRAFQEFDQLGGGFKLALHDLEIRGAGNLLGQQQSGHIAAVGFELYTEMMEAAVRELSGEASPPEVEPEIRVGIAAYFPEDYIPDANQRLLFYRRLAGVGDADRLTELKDEIRDRYGPFPEEVENLFCVMRLRRLLKDHLVEQMTCQDGKASLRFHAQSRVNVERVVQIVHEDGGTRVSPDGRLAFTPRSRDWEGLVDEVAALLERVSAPAQFGFSGRPC
jgi:transcription-repair coupling factor (superfamily II helicase)